MVSLCFSAFVVDKTHAIDIETLEEHKRRNYGAAVAQAFVQECLQKEFVHTGTVLRRIQGLFDL